MTSCVTMHTSTLHTHMCTYSGTLHTHMCTYSGTAVHSHVYILWYSSTLQFLYTTLLVTSTCTCTCVVHCHSCTLPCRWREQEVKWQQPAPAQSPHRQKYVEATHIAETFRSSLLLASPCLPSCLPPSLPLPPCFLIGCRGVSRRWLRCVIAVLQRVSWTRLSCSCWTAH